MTDLKPGYVRVFQCEACGEFLFPGNLNACDGRYHTRRIDGSDYDCGPITERILADPDVVRREAIVMLGELIHDDEIEWPNTITEESIDEACRALSERDSRGNESHKEE